MNRSSGISGAGKYVALTRYLLAVPSRETTVTLSFRDLESILAFSIPPSAHKHRPWWANQTDNAGRPQAQGWVDAGFVVDSVNIGAGTVRFARKRRAAVGASISVKPTDTAASAVDQQPCGVAESAIRNRATRNSIDSGMRRQIVLVSCAAKKAEHQAQAQDLYVSPLFQRALAYARVLGPDEIYILSAKYGLLELTVEIEPYDLTLKDMSLKDARAWADKVLSQLAEKADLRRDTFVFLAGDAYRRFIVPKLAHWEAPLAGLPIGKQLQRLDQLLDERRL